MSGDETRRGDEATVAIRDDPSLFLIFRSFFRLVTRLATNMLLPRVFFDITINDVPVTDCMIWFPSFNFLSLIIAGRVVLELFTDVQQQDVYGV